MVKLFQKKSVVIEAVQWNGDNREELLAWGAPVTLLPASTGLIIRTLEDGPNCEAVHVADLNDWIIKGVKGEFYPCKPDIFEASYNFVAPKERPTIAELEAILNEPNSPLITINPDGSISAG